MNFAKAPAPPALFFGHRGDFQHLARIM